MLRIRYNLHCRSLFYISNDTRTFRWTNRTLLWCVKKAISVTSGATWNEEKSNKNACARTCWHISTEFSFVFVFLEVTVQQWQQQQKPFCFHYRSTDIGLCVCGNVFFRRQINHNLGIALKIQVLFKWLDGEKSTMGQKAPENDESINFDPSCERKFLFFSFR